MNIFSNEELEHVAGSVASTSLEQGLALELLALYKEREAAVPVAWRYRTTNISGDPNPDWSFSEEASLLGLYQPLYAAPPAQPVAVPETLPCSVMLEPGLRFGKGVRTKTMLDALQRRAEYYAELEAMTPEQRADHEAGIKEFASMLRGGLHLHEDTLRSKCWCRTCRPVDITDMRFVVCPECGNKRCPKANDHRNDCNGSNEPGQDGSAYPAAPGKEG